MYWEYYSLFNQKKISLALGKKKDKTLFFIILLSFLCSIEIQRWPLLSIETSDAMYQSVGLSNILMDLFSSFQFHLCFEKEKDQCCCDYERELCLHTAPALDTASVVHLPGAHFVLYFRPFFGVSDLMNCCNNFVTKSGQHWCLASLYAFSWPMQLDCDTRLNDSWLL